jgi:hypothetical protein
MYIYIRVTQSGYIIGYKESINPPSILIVDFTAKPNNELLSLIDLHGTPSISSSQSSHAPTCAV